MIKNIILRDNAKSADLYPFSILHPSYELRCGCLRIFEKYRYYFYDAKISFKTDDLKLKSFLQRFGIADNSTHNSHILQIDGDILPSSQIVEFFERTATQNACNINYVFQNEQIAIYQLDSAASEYITVEVPEKLIRRINYLWEALDFNAEEIENDALFMPPRFKRYEECGYKCASAIGDSVYIGANVTISPGVVFDSSAGSIIIDDGVVLMPNSVIMGPAYIGKNSIIKIGAKIYPYCSFGEHCKVGGELEATIIQAYSNKQHDGFLGHSYICEWVNLGADTNNSDLKNTYSNIVMRLPGKRVPSGRMFIGLMAGDHSKSAINSQFTTGTTVGIHCNLFDSGFFPNQIPSFTWGGQKGSGRHNFEQAIDTAKIVMGRRNRELTEYEIELMRLELDASSQ